MNIKDMIIAQSLNEEKDGYAKKMDGKGDCSKMQAAGATYKEYKKAVMKKFNAKGMKDLGKEGIAYLDKHWKAKDE